MELNVGIIGASGYTGAELLRLLAKHPHFKVKVLTAESQAGQNVSELYPHLHTFKNYPLKKLSEVQSDLEQCDLVFCALPHGEAMKILPSLRAKILIDLGADFRLKDPSLYEEWYKRTHVSVPDLKEWQYGLPELFRSKIRIAKRIANPGCYATITTLCLAPLVKAGVIDGVITVDAASGTSGAGRGPSAGQHFSHVFEDMHAYRVGKHQHTPEIEAVLHELGGSQNLISFTAHLVPMVRGIHATCSAQVKSSETLESVQKLFSDMYAKEPFVRLTSYPPGTKEVRGSNAAVISVSFDKRCGRVIVTGVIDNLVKGASGQAIQNANIVAGLDETLGLMDIGLYP